MHQRSWLSLITLPLVAGFSYPMVLHRLPQEGRTAVAAQDPLAGMADIQDVLVLIRDNYVDPPDLNRVIGGGIQATLERAHGLNSYLSLEDLNTPDPGPASTGVRLFKRGTYAHVAAVQPESPAAKAGIIPGDVIGKVDGRSVATLNAWQLERRLRGAKGSSLSLSVISAASGQTRKVDLVRDLLPRPAIALRREGQATVLGLPDLETGRAAELGALLSGLDPALPLLLDLRQCAGGTLEEAQKVGTLLQLTGPFATVQAAGKPDRQISLPAALGPGWVRLGVLFGFGTAGPAEVLCAALKEAGRPTYGGRTASLGVGLTRLPLRHGGAVELVTERMLTPKGLKLDRETLKPAQELHGLRPDEDPVPRVLEQLSSAAPVAAPKTVARAWYAYGSFWVWRFPTADQV